MKNKDLNTYISEKLDQGNGLPYKEEYWNDMNGLLDANMPVMKPAVAASQVTTNGFKWLYLSSVCAAVFTVSYMYLHLFTPSSQTSSENVPTTASQAITSKTLSTHSYKDVATSSQHEETLDPQRENIEQENTEVTEAPVSKAKAQTQNEIIHDQTKPHTPVETVHSDSHEPSTLAPAHAEAGMPVTTLLSKTEEPIYDLPIQTTVNQVVSSRSVDFMPINPIAINGTVTEISGLNRSQLPLISYPKRKRLVQHIAVSPFIGVVYESGKQTYRYQNAEYTHPVQSHLTYGVNIECATKQFAVRTGIGWSNTQSQKSLETSQDIYKVDTSFVIVNPNYATTLSGKPIALVKRQIDSSVVSKENSTAYQSTTYQYITIPLTLQYRIAHKRLAVVFEGGALHHFIISQKTNAPIQQVNPENHFQLPGYSIQLTAGSGLRFAVSSKWSLGIQYNYTLNPLSANMHFLNNAHVATLMITRTLR